MTTAEAIATLANKNRTGAKTVLATVTAVNESDYTIDVEPINDEAAIYGVRVKAEGETDKGFICLPKVGSVVAVQMLNKSTGFVAMFSELDSLKVKVGSTLLTINQSGYTIANGGESLKSILSDLLQALQALTVTCASPGSPSSPPINTAAFNALSTRLNSLFE